MEYKEGHYYKRIFKQHNNKFVIFKVINIFKHNDFMFVVIVKDMLAHGKFQSKEYECSYRMKSFSKTRTVELTDVELTTILL